MARGSWPANSLAEWVVGQNFRHLTKAPPDGPSPVLKVELSESEASGDETLAITFPRRRHDVAAQSAAPAARKVRFHGDRKPLKSALKKSIGPNESSDTLVDTSEDEDAEDTTDDEYSNVCVVCDTDTSDEDVPIRRRRSKSKQSKATLCKKETGSDSSAAKDALPHPTCHCDGCVKGRKILKAVIKFEAKKGVKVKQAKSARRRKSQGTDDDTETSDASDSPAESTDEETRPKKEKNKKQKQKEKQKRQQKSSPRQNEEETTKAVNKNAWRVPTYPKEMQPQMIMPPRTKVVQVEHTVETGNDPRPNAFFDSTRGITRVYHGPQYGNHMGELYGHKNTDGLMPPVSAFPPVWQPHNASWYPPGPTNGLPGFSYAQPMSAVNGQMPVAEAGWADAASKGMGLSGMPAAPTPPLMREELRQRASGKAASQNASFGQAAKSTTWDAPTAWGGGGVGSSNPAGAPKHDTSNWFSGFGMGGDTSGSKKDGVASPANFDTFGASTGEKFERNSKKTESQKSQKSQKSAKSAKWGQDDAWDTDKNNSGWGQENENDWTKSTPWNGEQKQPSDAASEPKQPSADNGAPENGGGHGWGTNDGNAGWGAQAGGWNGSDNGSKKNAWDGPSKSKPHDGQHGNNSNKNSNSGLGAWGQPDSPKHKGAFDWPTGQVPPAGTNNGGHGFTYNCYEGAPARSRANSHNGGHQGGPTPWQDAGIAQNTGGKAEQW